MVLEALLAQAADILELATSLLRLGRQERDAYFREKNQPGNVYAYQSLVVRAEPVFRQVRGERLDAERRELLLSLLAEFPRVPAVIRASALATALDLAVGQRLALGFRHTRIEAAPGDPVPVLRPPLKDLFGQDKELTSHPHRASDSPDRIPHLCLLPEDTGSIRITLDSLDADQSCPLIDLEQQLLATGIPNFSEDEFVLEPRDEAGALFFFPYVPKSSGEQCERLLGILQKAARSGATVLVLPELCADEKGISCLAQEFQKAPGSLRLLVAGSHHVLVDGQPRNECVALLRGSRRELRHWKFSTFSYSDQESRREVTEGILSDPRRLTIFLSDQWSFTLLICKDLLDPEVRHLIEALGISLVLVPALTPKIDLFEAYAASLAVANQAVVLVANNPIFTKGTRVHSIFSVPRQGRFQDKMEAGAKPLPGVCCYHMSEATLTWLDAESKVD